MPYCFRNGLNESVRRADDREPKRRAARLPGTSSLDRASDIRVFREPTLSAWRILSCSNRNRLLLKECDRLMHFLGKPYVHVPIDAVDTVIFDPEGLFDPEQFDHYETFEAARDAALSSIEVMLDEEDYDGEDHCEELERMHDLLEASSSFEELEQQPFHRWLCEQLDLARTAAA